MTAHPAAPAFTIPVSCTNIIDSSESLQNLVALDLTKGGALYGAHNEQRSCRHILHLQRGLQIYSACNIIKITHCEYSSMNLVSLLAACQYGQKSPWLETETCSHTKIESFSVCRPQCDALACDQRNTDRSIPSSVSISQGALEHYL